MRKLWILGVLVLGMVLTSCSTENETVMAESEMATIRLTGDIEVAQTVLTRSTGAKRYYAFEVDSIANGDYHPYAEGVFDNLMTFQVRLLKNTNYRVRVIVLEEYGDKMYNNGGLREPFAGTDKTVAITNKFSYRTDNVDCWGSTTYFRIDNGSYSGSLKINPSLNFYAGEATVNGNGNITISMKRRNIGIRFGIVPPKEGTLTVRNIYYEPHFDYLLTKDSEKIETTNIYAIPLTTEYANMRLEVVWTDKYNITHDLSQSTRELAVNTMTTVNVDVTGRSSGGGGGSAADTRTVSLQYDGDMTDGEVITVK